MRSAAAHGVPRLLIRFRLMPDESVVSFVQRHAEANRAASMRHMLQLLAQVSGTTLKDVRDLVHSRAALRAVEWLTGLADGELESRYLERQYPAYLVSEHHVWESSARIAPRQAVCPACLEESGYAKLSWEFVQAPVCVSHGTALLEHCPYCAEPLRHNRTRLKCCQRCGANLSKARAHGVSDAVLQVANFVQSPSMVRMGDADATAPIDQLDLSKLLRLCVLPGPGCTAYHGLTGPLHHLPAAARIMALERLGSAMAGPRIDSSRLRSIVVERWPGASLLPEESTRVLIMGAAQMVEMDVEAAGLLCFGDLHKCPKSAAELYNGRPPRLANVDDVAQFLGVDLHVLSQLSARHGLHKAGRGQGHDMDEVLALQRHVESVCKPEMLDGVLGWPGLTASLVHLKLLTGLVTEDGTLLGVEPESFGILVSRIRSAMSSSTPRDARAVPLSEGTRFGMDAAAVAWAVAQIAGGSLAAFDWPPPCRLCDLMVDVARLEQLSNGVSSPTSASASTATA